MEDEYTEYLSVCNYFYSLKCKLLNEYKYDNVVYFTVNDSKEVTRLIIGEYKNGNKWIRWKLIPKYLVTENNFLESEIAKVRAKLEENNKKIDLYWILKTIRWDDIKTIKMASYASVAKLIDWY